MSVVFLSPPPPRPLRRKTSPATRTHAQNALVFLAQKAARRISGKLIPTLQPRKSLGNPLSGGSMGLFASDLAPGATRSVPSLRSLSLAHRESLGGVDADTEPGQEGSESPTTTQGEGFLERRRRHNSAVLAMRRLTSTYSYSSDEEDGDDFRAEVIQRGELDAPHSADGAAAPANTSVYPKASGGSVSRVEEDPDAS